MPTLPGMRPHRLAAVFENLPLHDREKIFEISEIRAIDGGAVIWLTTFYQCRSANSDISGLADRIFLMDEMQLAKNGERHAGMFRPGVSGNPSGRPKSDATIRELAKAHTEVALLTLVEIIQNKKAPPSARVHAASAILDRGWGKPNVYVEATTSVNVTLMDALDQIGERLKARGRIIDAEVMTNATARVHSSN